MDLNPPYHQLWELLKTIPKGKVISYGRLANMLRPQATARQVGTWIAQCPTEIPWWRVLASDGSLSINKRDPHLGMIQKKLLLEEGVEFDQDKVRSDFFWDANGQGKLIF